LVLEVECRAPLQHSRKITLFLFSGKLPNRIEAVIPVHLLLHLAEDVLLYHLKKYPTEDHQQYGWIGENVNMNLQKATPKSNLLAPQNVHCHVEQKD
jgi:hypothetical protein